MITSEFTTIGTLFGTNFFNLDNDIQRSYEWNVENVKRFIKDINENEKHFIGIILTTAKGNYITIYDGQQRFTTSVLCACAVSNILTKRDEKTDYFYKQEENRLLKSYNRNSESTYKLTLRDDDNELLIKIIDGKIDFNKEEKKSFVYKNYKKIEEILKEYSTDAIINFYDHLLNANICRLIAHNDEEARKQFYYLNSGQVLTETRRLISLLVTHSNGNHTLQNFSSKLSQEITEDDVNRLFSLFSWYHYGVDYTEKNLTKLENELKDNKNNICSKIYEFYTEWFEPMVINKCFTDDRKKFNFVFKNCFTESNNNAIQIFTIAILNTNQLDKRKEKALKAMEWVVLCKRCVNNTGTAKTISQFFNEWDRESDIYQYVKEHASKMGFWLNANKLVNKLNEEKKGEDAIKTLLSRIESVSMKEQSTPTNKVTLEHIYPQNPSKKLNYDEIIEPYYRFGNLTLLGDSSNSSIKNSIFVDKKETYKGSCYEVTRRLTKYNKWTKYEVENTECFYKEQLIRYYELF